MRYLLFEYGESPMLANDLPKVRYCYDKNLNILESNNKPAIGILDNCATQTSTKVHNEQPDSDDNYMMSLGTKTLTLVNSERSDNEYDSILFASSLITMTSTRVEMESTDQD